jgi:adenylate cyclase
VSRAWERRADLAGAAVELIRPGEQRTSGRTLARATSGAVIVTLAFANVLGAFALLAILTFVAPLPPVADAGHARLVNLIAVAAFGAAAIPLGVWIGTRTMARVREWLESGRPAGPEECRAVLRAPRRLLWLQVGVWLAAAITFGLINWDYSLELGWRVALIVIQTGVVTAAIAYLLAERILRGVAARALADAQPDQLRSRGIVARALLAWAVGSGIAGTTVAATGVFVLAGDDTTRHEMAIVMVVIGMAGVIVGLIAEGLAARATADPINSVRRALARVQAGELDVRVPVYDGTQLGQLQAGFNRMVEGLAERERIREMFGTYVDPDVAARILEEGPSLEGEEVDATIMFVDVREFTVFAERTPAREVVATINGLFATIVPIIHDHGGRVDKYTGDGVMAVFGTPRQQPDHADKALGAALVMARAVQSGLLQVGIGLNSGRVIVGNVGADERLEFSVIGSAVNVAARVEAATRQTGDTILLTEATRQLLAQDDTELRRRSGVELKGTSDRVELFAPVLDS